jgi:HK97 family phage major capsid protein
VTTTLEMIKELHDKRGNLLSQEREAHAAVEAAVDDTGRAEAQQRFDRVSGEVTDLTGRINNLMSVVEQQKEADEQRERFAGLLAPPSELALASESFQERIRNWLRAGTEGHEDVYAPRAITISQKALEFHKTLQGATEVHDLTKGTATDGAELIPTSFVRRLFEHLIAFSAIRQTNALVMTTDSGENLLVPKTTSYGAATLVAEAGPILEDDPQFAQVTVGAYKYGQLIQISRELVEDSAIDILGFLARSAGRALGVATGAAYVTGTGSAQPQGIANAPTAGVTGGAGTGVTVTGDQLIQLYHSLLPGYRSNGYWVMNDATAAFIRQIKDSSGGAGVGNYLWQPGMVAGAPDTLFGRPVVFDPNMATMAINAYSIAFGDFSEYFVIRDVDGIRFERSDDFAFANDLVTFRALLRTDSRQLVNGANGAVKFYRNGAS